MAVGGSCARGAGRRARAPRSEDGPELGDIALAFETCAREAAEAGNPFENHVLHLVVHGTLHLLGYDHVRDADGDLMEADRGRDTCVSGGPGPILSAEGAGMAFVCRKGQMGDTQDGSPSAAQSALPEGGDEPGPRPGSEPNFLKKIFGVFGGAEPELPRAKRRRRPNPRTAPARPTLGLGNLRRMRVEDVMLPKAEIVAVEVDTPKQGLVEVFRESGMTRLPVYENTLDSPLGLVHLKDFALSHGFNGGGERYNLRKMLRPLLYVPPSMPLGVLLQKMQTGRMHMALVIDEYGGVDGLVTIEDLIEQVIGEIEDEHDTEDDRPFTLEKPGCYLALARTPLDEFEAEIGRKLVMRRIRRRSTRWAASSSCSRAGCPRGAR